jgi:hypothetical protein
MQRSAATQRCQHQLGAFELSLYAAALVAQTGNRGNYHLINSKLRESGAAHWRATP